MTSPKETIRLGAIEIRFLLDGDDTGGRLSMFEFLVPPGARVPAPHYHEHVDEVAYGLEGVLTFTVDGRSTSSPPGAAASSRAGPCTTSPTGGPSRRGRCRC